MKKLILCALLIASGMVCRAQMADVSKPKALLAGVQSNMYNPVLSEDGTKLLFSASDFTDLRMYDFNNNVTVAVEATRQKAFKAHFKANKLSFGTSGARTDGKSLYITVDGVEKACRPVEGSNGYCWGKMSPDGTKVVFLAAGKGLYVADINGDVIAALGNYSAPVWFGNSHLVGENSTDDGHQYHSSQILLLDLDGNSQQLTRPESMSMSPAAAIDANRVVYTTVDGRLYELTVTLK